MKTFRFFYKCAICADPRFGIYFHTWSMILMFITFPFIILSLFIFDKFYSSIIVVGNVMIIYGIRSIVFAFIRDKTHIKITKFLLGVPPILPKSKSEMLAHQFYFYGISMGLWMIPLILMFLLDLWGYWGDK